MEWCESVESLGQFCVEYVSGCKEPAEDASCALTMVLLTERLPNPPTASPEPPRTELAS